MSPIPVADILGDGSQLWEELYEGTGFHRDRDPENGHALQRVSEGLCAPLQLPHDIARARDDQPAPFAILFDPDECPAGLLPYSVQYVGVEITPEMSEAQIREEFRAPSGWNRGQLAAIKLAGQRTLTGTKRVIVRSRTPSVGHHYIRTLKSETPDPERTRARFRAAVPAWEALDYEAITGVSWADIAASYADWDAVKAAFTDWDDLADTLPSELPEP